MRTEQPDRSEILTSMPPEENPAMTDPSNAAELTGDGPRRFLLCLWEGGGTVPPEPCLRSWASPVS